MRDESPDGVRSGCHRVLGIRRYRPPRRQVGIRPHARRRRRRTLPVLVRGAKYPDLERTAAADHGTRERGSSAEPFAAYPVDPNLPAPGFRCGVPGASGNRSSESHCRARDRKSTHHTPPRSMGCRQGIAGRAFGPLQRLLFLRLVGCHVAIGSFDIVRHYVGARQSLHKLADPAPPGSYELPNTCGTRRAPRRSPETTPESAVAPSVRAAPGRPAIGMQWEPT